MAKRTRLENRVGHYLARRWGEVQRRIAIGGVVYPDGQMVVDGWSSRSPSAQWKDNSGGASYRKPSQPFPEVHDRDSIIVARCIDQMTEPQRIVLWIVYVEGRGIAKAAWLARPGISRDAVYRLLHESLDIIEKNDGQEMSEK